MYMVDPATELDISDELMSARRCMTQWTAEDVVTLVVPEGAEEADLLQDLGYPAKSSWQLAQQILGCDCCALPLSHYRRPL